MFFRLPWNHKTPIGYIGELLFHIITGQMFLFCTGVVLLLFIAMCLHHKAFYQMYCHSLHKFECSGKNRNHAEELCELIRFHASIKRLASALKISSPWQKIIGSFYAFRWMLVSAEAYSYFMLVQLIFVTVSIGVILFLMDMVCGVEVSLHSTKCIVNSLFYSFMILLPILANSTFRLWYFDCIDWVFSMHVESVCVLLLR